jgi:superfamily II DNA/RNA helicase
MYDDVKLFFPDDNIDVVMISGVDLNYARERILILDEADAMIDECKIKFSSESRTSSEVCGMIAVAQSKKTILLSATFADHHLRFIR